MAGRSLLHFTVIQEYDLGNLGRFIKAMDTKSNKLVGLKFPPREFLADFVMRKAEWKRFVDDMNTAQSIQHPSLCNVTETNEFNGEFFYVTDYFEGVTLRDLVETQVPQPKVTLGIVEKVLEVFDIYHPKNICLNVLRADHIYLTNDGHVKLLDLPSIRLRDFVSLRDEEDHLLSMAYMAPELVKREATDERSDLYSIGVIMYQLLTGKLPFTGKTVDELIYAIVYQDPPPVSAVSSAVPEEISLVVKRMLSKNPAWRYKRAADLLAEIKRLKQTTGGQDELPDKHLTETLASLVPIVHKRLELHPPRVPPYRKEIITTVVLKPEPAKPEPPKAEEPKREPPKRESVKKAAQKSEPPPETEPPEKPSSFRLDVFTEELLRSAEEEARKAALFGSKSYPETREREGSPAPQPPSHEPFQPVEPDQHPAGGVPAEGMERPHLPTVEEFIVPPIAEGETEERKLSSIVFTDIRAFSKKMGENEAIAMRVLQMHNTIMETLFAKYGGKVIKSIGDAFMVDFSSAVNAVRCAVEAQERLWEHNRSRVTELERVFVRIGIHMGDVVIKGNDIFGDAVNIAARIESISEAGRITITADVYQQVRNKMPLDVMYLGKRQLKNIQEPIDVYQIMLNTIPETLPTTDDLQRAQQLEAEERRRQEEEFHRKEEEAERQRQARERRKKELEEQRKAEEELRRRRAEEERRRKEEEARHRRQEEERVAALHKAVATCLQAANNEIAAEQFEQAAEEIAHAFKLDPGNEDIRLMESRLRIAQEEARQRHEEMQRRLEEDRQRREAEEARRKAEEEVQRVAMEEERRRKEEQERREMHLKRIAEYLEKGELYLRDADFEKARNELSRIYILDPGNAAARVFEGKIKDYEIQLAREREEREMKKRAEEDEARRKRERENQIQMFIVRAQDLYHKHRYDEAIDEIVRIYAIDPKNAQAHQWERKIRSAQDSHQETADMLDSSSSVPIPPAEIEEQIPGDTGYEIPTLEREVPAPATAVSQQRKWIIMGIGAIGFVVLLLIVSGPLFQSLFSTKRVVIVEPFEANAGAGDAGRGLAVLVAGDLGVVRNISVVDPLSASRKSDPTVAGTIAKYQATHLITGRLNLVKNQIDLTLTVEDSMHVLSSVTVTGTLEAFPQFRADLRGAIAEAFNVSGRVNEAPPITSSSKPDAILELFEALAEVESGRFGKAILDLDSAVAIDTGYAEAYSWLASVLLDSCEVLGNAKNEIGARAKAAAQKSVDLNPQLPGGYAQLATYDRLVGDFLEARTAAQKALSISPSNAAANAELAITSLVTNDMKTAGEHALSATTLDPQSYRAWLASALTNHYSRRFKEAAGDYQRALSADHTHMYETTTFLMADAMQRASMNDLATGTYINALSKSPDDYFIAYRLGRVYQGIGKKSEGDRYLEQARKNASDALAKNQDDSQARMVLGLALMRLGRFNDGFTQVQRVADANPENPTFLYGLARAYAINMKEKEALDALTKAVEKEYRISSVLDLDLFNLEGNERFTEVITLQDTQH